MAGETLDLSMLPKLRRLSMDCRCAFCLLLTRLRRVLLLECLSPGSRCPVLHSGNTASTCSALHALDLTGCAQLSELRFRDGMVLGCANTCGCPKVRVCPLSLLPSWPSSAGGADVSGLRLCAVGA